MNQSQQTATKNGTTAARPRLPGQAARPSKHYGEEFKQQAMEHWIKSGKPGTVLAAELGISYPSLKDWKARDSGDATPERDTLEAERR